MIYIASPYSDPSPIVREHRFTEVYRYTLRRMQMGLSVFSPIVYGHQFAADYPWTAAAWQEFNRDMFHLCNTVEVLMLEGWQQSLGIKMELQWAEAQSAQVKYVEPLP